MTVTVVVGNPKPRSRTWTAALGLVERLGRTVDHAIDLVDLGPDLLGWGTDAAHRAVDRVRGSDLVVVASPTFKATYTGLLKLFLEKFDTGCGLSGVTVVPLMLGGSPAHALAPELHLKPVLVEIGASCPTAGLYLLDSAGADDPALEEWLGRWRSQLEPRGQAGE